MRSSSFVLATGLASVLAVPAPQAAGTLGLGEQCSSSSQCANGANCYSTNSGLITLCGNFQASCSSNDQCAYNTCENGLCNGFIPATTSTASAQPTQTSTMVYLPLGADCNPNSTPCANGVDCYATNYMLQPRCGNFQAICASDSQCAFNTCQNGLCNGFIASTSTTTNTQTASSTTSALSYSTSTTNTQTIRSATSASPSSTPTTVYLPLGADCSPDSTPCANGAQCYATNSMLQPRCGNFQSECTTDAQCAFNTCNQGLCNGFIASDSSSAAGTATSNVASSATNPTSLEGNSPVQSTAVIVTTPVVTESSVVVTTASVTGGPTSTPTSSTPGQLNTNAASASKSGPLGLTVADVKPDNILINYDRGPRRFREIELRDCGDACLVNPKNHLKLGENGPMIRAHMFRSPEAMLNLRWGTATDIWSFGTTISDLDLRHSDLDLEDAGPDDESYPNHVQVKQIGFFGPFPLSYFDFLPKEDERWECIGDATQYIINHQKWKPFAKAEDNELAEEDRMFICKIMKLDPRDRPTAKELLQDP
ncbi:kinase-like domain-containing protein [Rhexocercosporidium sp. MPI-PUGE-AT-0058]|nr:kinase-like domain-containing protein [Rhexocercosporidium sp. MPI-PUGE-AT-0058]